MSPDALVSDVKNEDGRVKPDKLAVHERAVEGFVGELQDRNLTPSSVANYVKAIRSLYRVNGIEIKLPHALPRQVVYRQRAPKPEELERVLAVADLRGRVIVSMQALGGFREGTLVRLKYRHVKDDLEKGVIPVHVHVEAYITKGKYHEYDTFLGEEAVQYMRLYLEARRKGNIHPEIPPEQIGDESPLIRNERHADPRPISEKQIRKIVHELYFKAGLLERNAGSRYSLCVHSLRKYFKTQLTALGVQSDYVEYMMGHTISVYNDIESNGIEFLRNIYGEAGLSIKPKSTITKLDMVKEFVRGMGMNPEEILVRNAFSEPDTKYIDPQERERTDIRLLMGAIKQELIGKANHEKLTSNKIVESTKSA